MEVRHIKHGTLGQSDAFNIHSLSEVIVYYSDGECSSEFMGDLEVNVGDGRWKPMLQAFKDRDIVPNNLNTAFGYPRSTMERSQGYNEV